MKQTRNFLRQVLWILVVTATMAGFHACDDDDLSSPLTLQYMEVVNIGTGMSFSATPYYRGATPTEFTIQKVKLNGEEAENKGFTINAETGVITISHNNQLAPGKYALSIGCNVNGSILAFADVFIVNMLPAAPATFKYKQPLITSEYGKFDTAYVAEISESVEINKFVLAEEGDATYFQIDPVTGTVCWKEFPIAETPEPRHYYPMIGIVTPAGTQYYNNVLEFNITSAPMKLRYEIASKETEKNYSDTSALPVFMGSPDQLVYSVKSAKFGETTTDKIRITTDGRIYVDKNNEEMTAGAYKISLSVTNQYGSKDFEDVFTWNIVNYIAPIENFTYAETTCNRLKAFSISVADNFEGDGVTFSFVDKPASLTDLTINAATGEISAVQGHKLPIGDYTITVKAVNSKAPEGKTTTLVLHVQEHPNYFSLVYGNNLGLAPATNYANQYAFPKSMPADTTILPVGNNWENTVFSIVSQRSSNAKNSTFANIDAATGALTFKTSGLGAGGMSVVIIEATKGEGENAYKVRIPVFMQNFTDNSAKNPTYYYAPFVLRINPAKGGVSNSIVLAHQSLKDAGAKLRIDFKDQQAYYDLRSDFDHLSSTGNTVAQSTLLKTLWSAYFNRDDKTTDKTPISCFKSGQLDTDPNSLATRLCYIDQTDYKVHVNPGIWKDGNGNLVNGIFWARCTGNLTSGDPQNTLAAFPVAIWFDPEF